VVFGIDEARIRKIIDTMAYEREVCVATGIRPVEGQDGFFEYKFNMDLNTKPQENSDGSVDYWSIHTLETVEEGQVIATYHEPVEGSDGKTVTDKVVPCKRARALPPLAGKGFTRSEDNCTYTADLNGKIEMKNGRVMISNIHEVMGDVDLHTGNIDFRGDVLIHGSVTPGAVVKATGSITVDGKEITIYAMPKAQDLPWGKLGVDVVLECTGFYCSKDKAQAHITAGAKKVVISAPAGNDLKTIVFSVNEKTLTADDQIISAASCTTNCLAPMAKALNDYAPIQSGIMSTIHAYTGDQMILDGPHRKGDLRRARAGAANIVPNSTGAAKAIGLVIPELNGKLIGSAQRVPVPTGSTTILTAVVKGADVTVDGINAAMKAAASESFGYNEDAIVSSDVIGMRYGSLFDATQTMVSKVAEDLYEVQVVSWYDNENSYTSQMVRTIKYFAELA